MADTDLVKGAKETLIEEFKGLYLQHGKKWRSLLKKHNEWHSTDTALMAWNNISKKTVGNESLRLIISDMKEILAKSSKQSILKKQGLTRPTLTKQQT